MTNGNYHHITLSTLCFRLKMFGSNRKSTRSPTTPTQIINFHFMPMTFFNKINTRIELWRIEIHMEHAFMLQSHSRHFYCFFNNFICMATTTSLHILRIWLQMETKCNALYACMHGAREQMQPKIKVSICVYVCSMYIQVLAAQVRGRIEKKNSECQNKHKPFLL